MLFRFNPYVIEFNALPRLILIDAFPRPSDMNARARRTTALPNAGPNKSVSTPIKQARKTRRARVVRTVKIETPFTAGFVRPAAPVQEVSFNRDMPRGASLALQTTIKYPLSGAEGVQFVRVANRKNAIRKRRNVRSELAKYFDNAPQTEREEWLNQVVAEMDAKSAQTAKERDDNLANWLWELAATGAVDLSGHQYMFDNPLDVERAWTESMSGKTSFMARWILDGSRQLQKNIDWVRAGHALLKEKSDALRRQNKTPVVLPEYVPTQKPIQVRNTIDEDYADWIESVLWRNGHRFRNR